MAVPFDLLVIGEGLLPDGTRATFFVSRREIDALLENGQSEKLHHAGYLAEVIDAPDAIFRGLRRVNQDESLCYSVRPERDPDGDGDGDESSSLGNPAVLPRYGQAFLAFVRVADMGYVIFDWEWRDEDPEAPGHPLNWKRDFEAKVYGTDPN